jgi:CPA2 family monovalent cation:H+ antiporter-2
MCYGIASAPEQPMSTLTPFVTQNFLEDMGLTLCVAAVATVICQFLRLPLLVGYLIAGIVVGPFVPGVYASMERVHLVSDLGVTVLVFSIGLDFNFRRLMQLAPTAGLVALLQVVAMVGLGYSVGLLMGWSPWECLVTGAMVSISGVVILAKAFEEVPVEPRVRELVFGVVMCEDVIAILMLAVLITIAKGGGVSLYAFTIEASLLSLFIVVLITIGLITVPYVLGAVARFKRPETLLITSLGLCFGLAMIAERAGYSMILGAFLAGSLVAESAESSEIEKLIEPVRHIFGALFFVSVGMLIDPLLLLKYWPALVFLSIVVITGKIISVFLASLLIGERIDIAVKSGPAMAQIGVFAILLGRVASGGGAPSGFLYSLAVGVCSITAFLCPLLIRASNPVGSWIERYLTKPVQRALSQEDAS